MAHVPLTPLGRPRGAFLDESSYQRHREAMAEKNALLEERRAAVRNALRCSSCIQSLQRDFGTDQADTRYN